MEGHGVHHRRDGRTPDLTRQARASAGGDLIPILQFGALMFIVLPLLPDTAYGPGG